MEDVEDRVEDRIEPTEEVERSEADVMEDVEDRVEDSIEPTEEVERSEADVMEEQDKGDVEDRVEDNSIEPTAEGPINFDTIINHLKRKHDEEECYGGQGESWGRQEES